MLNLTRRLEAADHFDATLTLSYDVRQKSRFRTRLDNGQEVGVILSRGMVLREGDLLGSDEGSIVRICAAPETVSTVSVSDPLLLARAAYHLGNRHVPLQIMADSLRYQHDHVLDDMIRQMGLQVQVEQAPFEPEAGAYHGGHHHAHD